MIDQSRTHPEKLRRRVIVVFFMGLLLMALLALGVGWVCGEWGKFYLGWLNPALGIALTLGGLVLVIWSVHTQYLYGKGTPAPRVATQKLVTQGPYAYSRNPMTLGAWVLYLGLGVWIGSGVVIGLTVLVFSALLAYIYVHETHELAERFGDEYLEYMRQTPFLFPRLK